MDDFSKQVLLRGPECAMINPLASMYFCADTNLSFIELDEFSSKGAGYFSSLGLKKGDKVLVFLKPGLEFVITVFSLFKIGAVVVFIDPGMGVRNFLQCVQRLKPRGFVGISRAFLIRLIFPKVFLSLKTSVLVSNKWLPGLKNLKKIFTAKKIKHICPLEDRDQAAIVYTSGATGIPKGVVYTHKMFLSQISILKKIFSLSHKDVDCSCFPLFSLLNVVMGIKTIVPDMDPRFPAKVDPKKLVDTIKKYKVTFSSGSPAIWERVGEYLHKKDISLPSMKNLVMFGAPVRHHLHSLFQKHLPSGSTYTPYGATESLPVSNISGQKIQSYKLEETLKGNGTCVGRVVEGTKVKVIDQESLYEPKLSQYSFCKPDEIGELIVCGEQITHQYHQMPVQTSRAKIRDENGQMWHRMGDVGFVDREGYIWFLGRKDHVVKIKGERLYPAFESIFNEHPLIKKTALIAVQRESHIPAIVIERYDQKVFLSSEEKLSFKQSLIDYAQSQENTRMISHFFLRETLPVDTRHNIKINRKKLARLYEYEDRGALL